MRRHHLLLLALIVLALVVLPPFLSLGLQNTLVSMLVAALFAVSFNLLMGQGGMLSFGHAAFFGIGAFATLHLMLAAEDGLAVPTPLLPLAGGLAGLALGMIAGYFATMRAGVYFSLVTLALAELLHTLAPQWDGMFGGEAGLSSMRMPWGGLVFGSVLEVYYLSLAWVALCLLLLWAYTRTPFGRLTLALRDNEQRVRFMGYDTHKARLVVFAVSAMFSGVAGGLLALSNEVANYTMFGMPVSAQVVLHTFIGGSTVFLGPVVGAAILTLFAFFVSDLTRSWLLYQGVLFVLVMLYAPLGIGGIVELHLRHMRELRWRALAGPYVEAAAAGLLIAAGFVFVIESLAVLFSGDYAVLRRDAGGLPPFPFLGTEWQPLSPLTWLAPLLAMAGGGWLACRARHRIAPLWDEARRASTRGGETA